MHIYDTKILHELHTWSDTNFICGHIQYKQLCMWVYMKFEFHYASVQLPCIKIIEFHIWTYVKVSYVFTYATKKTYIEIFCFPFDLFPLSSFPQSWHFMFPSKQVSVCFMISTGIAFLSSSR